MLHTAVNQSFKELPGTKFRKKIEIFGVRTFFLRANRNCFQSYQSTSSSFRRWRRGGALRCFTCKKEKKHVNFFTRHKTITIFSSCCELSYQIKRQKKTLKKRQKNQKNRSLTYSDLTLSKPTTVTLLLHFPPSSTFFNASFKISNSSLSSSVRLKLSLKFRNFGEFFGCTSSFASGAFCLLPRGCPPYA